MYMGLSKRNLIPWFSGFFTYFLLGLDGWGKKKRVKFTVGGEWHKKSYFCDATQKAVIMLRKNDGQ